MKLSQYQINLFWFDTDQTEFINAFAENAFSQWVNKWITEIQDLKSNQ